MKPTGACVGIECTECGSLLAWLPAKLASASVARVLADQHAVHCRTDPKRPSDEEQEAIDRMNREALR